MNLYIKLHPSFVAWMVNIEKYGAIELSTNLLLNADNIYKTLSDELYNYNIDEVVVEKPFLKLIGDNQRKLADDIIHIQRTFGVLLYLLHRVFPSAVMNHISSKVARVAVYKTETISKDVQLSEVDVLLKAVQGDNYPPLAKLCLHDLLVLISFVNKQGREQW
jgi:hypothetical protein